MARDRTSASQMAKLQRQAAALELRRAGQDYRQIAQTLNCSKSQAQRDVAHALAEARVQIEGNALDLKVEDLDRLNALLGGLWTKRKEVGVVDRILKILERRAKLLGLDAPVKLAHTGKDGGPIAHRHDGIDLDKLTDAELDTYEALCTAAAARARAGSPGAGEATA